jgi:1-phosphofructokinase/tagatose 6-phosphate kinase
MRLGLRAEPAVVAPNVEEAEGAVGHEFNDADDLALGLTSLLEMGARDAIITRPEGCVAILSENGARHRYEVAIEPLDPVSGVGSGDCFLAGYAASRYEGAAHQEALAYGVACGAESTQHFGAGTLNPRDAERLMPRVEVQEVDVPAGVG